ncbi:host attachment protein [soil metagenome]
MSTSSNSGTKDISAKALRGTGWVVVADEAIARFLTTTNKPGKLEAVEALTDPAAHAKEGDLHVNDAGRRGGRVSSDGGRGTSTASVTVSAGENNQNHEARVFARRVSDHLAAALRDKKFEHLRIVAAPRFLGLLRAELDASVKAIVVEELDKDLIHESDDDIAKRFVK